MAEVEQTPDVSTPEGARMWFESVGMPYPHDYEHDLIRNLPGLIKRADAMDPKKRNEYLDFIRRHYSSDPLLIPDRYRTKNLLERGEPLSKIREMQLKAQVDPYKAMDAIAENLRGGITAVPDPEEDLDTYQGIVKYPIAPPGVFPEGYQPGLPGPAIGNPLKWMARLDVKSTPQLELYRRLYESVTGKPKSYADVMARASKFASHLVGPMPLTPTTMKRAAGDVYDTFSEIDPSNLTSVIRERIKNKLSPTPTVPPTAPIPQTGE